MKKFQKDYIEEKKKERDEKRNKFGKNRRRMDEVLQQAQFYQKHKRESASKNSKRTFPQLAQPLTQAFSLGQGQGALGGTFRKGKAGGN